MITGKAIETLLLEAHTKAQSDRILWEIVQHAAPPLPQRGAWTFGHCVEENPTLLKPVLSQVVEHLLNESEQNHLAVRRNLLRALCLADCLPEDAGHLFDRCLLWVGDTTQPAAIRLYSMVIAGRIAAPYPELCADVIDAIEANAKGATMAFRSRSLKVLDALRKNNGPGT